MRCACLLVLLTSISLAQEIPQEMPNWVVPSFTDLTIKTKQIRGLMIPQAETLYLKGTRERIEHGPAQARPGFGPFFAELLECDARTMVFLRPNSRTYRTSVEPEPRERKRKELPMITHPSDGPVVTVAIHSEDTGETRQVGGYVARRLKTTIQVEPSKGASTKPGKVEADTWFLDIPGLNCRAEDTRPTQWVRLYAQLLHPTSDHRDHVELKVSGAQPHGMVIEEIAKAVSDGNEMVLKTELLKASSDPLDPSLFEIPPDYTQVQPGSQIEPIHHEGNPK
jgi:hypothetical protein